MIYQETLKKKKLSFQDLLPILDDIDKKYSIGYKEFDSNAKWFINLSEERKVEVKKKAEAQRLRSTESADGLIQMLIERYQEICDEEGAVDDVKADAQRSIELIEQFGEEAKEYYSSVPGEWEASETEQEPYDVREQRLLTVCGLAFLEEQRGSPEEHAQKLASMFLSTKDALKYILADINNNTFPIHDACLFVLPEDRVQCDFPFWRSIIAKHLNDKEARALLPRAPELEKLIKSNAKKVSSETDYRAIKSAKKELIDLTRQFKELKQHRDGATDEQKKRYDELVSAISETYLDIYDLSEGLELKDMDLTILKAVNEYYIYSESEAYRYMLQNGLTKNNFRKFLGLNRLDGSQTIPDIKIDGEDLDEPEPGTYLMKVDVQDELQAARAACFGKLTKCCQSLSGEAGEPCTIHGLTNSHGGFYVVCKGDINNPTIHDELVAQSWVWRSQSGSIVFDSIEVDDYSSTNLVVKFYNSLSTTLIENEHTSKVACGGISGISRSFGTSCRMFKESFVDYHGHHDSEHQHVIIDQNRPYIASTDENEINSFVDEILASYNLAQNTAFIEMINYAAVESRDDIISQSKNTENEETLMMIENISGYVNAVDKVSYIKQKIDSMMPYLNKLVDREGQTALMHAAENGQTEIALRLIENGAKINEKDHKGHTALMYAAKNGQTEVALKLIEKGANVDEKDNDGNTALMHAVMRGKTSVALKLIESGANVDVKDRTGMTVLMHAVMRGKTSVALNLIGNGANVNEQNNLGNTALILAAYTGKTKVVLELIENGANIDENDNEGKTALMHAAENGRFEVALKLIESGANVDVKDRSGMTALMYAVMRGETSVALNLIGNGANVNEQNNLGNTALMYAAKNGQTEVALKFIEKGANVDEKDNDGNTALIHAITRGRTEVALKLIENGANVNVKDNKRNTALMYAAMKGQIDVALELIEKGANVDEKDRLGQTIYDCASFKVIREIKGKLEEMGQSVEGAKSSRSFKRRR